MFGHLDRLGTQARMLSALQRLRPSPLHLAALSWVALMVIAAVLVTVPQPAQAASGTFTDDDGSVHEGYIEAIAQKGITKGCGPAKFCPRDPVTREQMAAFLERALRHKIPETRSPAHFTDISTSQFRSEIAWLSATGITEGCTSDRFCPGRSVTREQMAAFLERALRGKIPETRSPAHFTDISTSQFRSEIAWLSATGLTEGCGSDRFCPKDRVTREQMASFLARALGLDPIQPSGPADNANLTASGPIRISNRSGVTIENMAISNPNGSCIQVLGSSNITIRNSTIGPCGDWAVFIDRSSSITVQNTTIRTDSSIGGVYGHSSSGIAVIGNTITNSGRNPVQFDKVDGAGNRIENNTIANSRAEDMISIFKSGGTSGSWLAIRGNTVRQNTGESNSGSGILVGDAGGWYTLVENNRLVDPGQAGIGVAGGTNIKVLNNLVSSRQFSWSNVGIYVWNQHSSSCSNIEVRGNSVDWISRHGKSNPAWIGGGCGNISGWNQNSW